MIELVYLGKARREGLDLYKEGIETGIISKHSRSAYHDPVLISFVFSVPLVMVLASLMFLVVPNKKIRAIRRRGPKFSRRKGIWWSCVRKVSGASERACELLVAREVTRAGTDHLCFDFFLPVTLL